jgi:hypothetical protein
MDNYDKIIDISGTLELAEIMNHDDKFKKRIPHYVELIKNNSEAKKEFNKIIIELNKIINNNNQTGGALIIPPGVILGGVVSSITLTAVVGFFIYRWFFAKKCRLEYPLYPDDRVPTIEDVIFKIFPKSWNGKGRHGMQLIKSMQRRVHGLFKYVSIFSAKSTMGSIAINAFRLTASVGATVLTAGVGTEIINFIFTFKNVLEIMDDYLTEIVEISRNPEALRLLYDISNINFKDGPYGVKCWIKYILDSYETESPAYRLVCGMFRKLMNRIAEFIGNMISSMLPQLSGIPAILAPLIAKYAAKGGFMKIISTLDSYYNKVPYHMKYLIENPSKMKEYLDKHIDLANRFLLGFGKKPFAVIKANTGFFAHGMSKMLAIIYAVMYLLVECLNNN